MFTLESKIIGHRGASAYAPENTLEAFQVAQALGCRCIEFDVMLSADQEAFVFHDYRLERTTNGTGEVGLLSAEYLKSLHCGKGFSKNFADTRIPTLREALVWIADTSMQANIEIKPYPGTTEQTTLAVLTHLDQYWSPHKNLPLVSCFDWDALRLCRSIIPKIPLALALDKWRDEALRVAKELQCFSIHISQRAANPQVVAKIKKEGFKVAVYTVNRKSQAQKLFARGVDAVFSDYPDLLNISWFKKLLGRTCEHSPSR